ncbi:spore germination protein [Halalkalibacterium halodurans]|uniref:BH2187 protein n=1 Tax=Halalkalibacterium halodurans (strain ATCC BAA-125 / DSM 18197 / FERM 7344 / JCM 9153 / C-125) TaxID=272558 RepID=Q9KAU9_HALH5|nr:spore germination protein [Halalkalibacterium halodurans]MDY7222743.1 spore germination protein [Halalkalibacterium halodurans]MDY7241964.1 spore germination protein [Halalkalibacterium halodurans]MED4123659.1 spore germination protein [Halalkalibacterium halodurans]MED4173675.1 spore germination protein [Halalkalibacterium halodurans]BAB05906.1 BH2187 [Halalkalibacterium halodurans C-125]
MEYLSVKQTVVLIVMIQVGVGILSLPASVAAEANNLGWVSVLLAGVIVQLAAVLYHISLKNIQEPTVFLFMEKRIGRLLTGLLVVALAIYFLLTSGILLRSFVELLHIWVYTETPRIMLVLLIFIPIVYLATGSITSLSNVSSFIIFLVIFLLSMLLFHLKQAQFVLLDPASGITMMDLLRGSLQTSLALIGFELIIFFHFYLKEKKRTLIVLTVSNWITVSCYTFVTFIAMLTYSAEKLEKEVWPTLSLYKLIELHIIQRLEFFIVMVWTPLMLITTGLYLWAFIKSIRYILPKRLNRLCVSLSLAVPVIALIPKTQPEVLTYSNEIGYIGIVISMVFPFILLLVKGMQVKGKEASV